MEGRENIKPEAVGYVRLINIKKIIIKPTLSQKIPQKISFLIKVAADATSLFLKISRS
jgi:hypothetical protein